MDKLIYQICDELEIDRQNTRTSLFKTKQKLFINDEDFKDLIQDTYIKYVTTTIDTTKNNKNFFTMIFKNHCLDYLKKQNRMSLYNDFEMQGNYTFEELITESFI